jgi:hypothetical protein
MHRRLAALLLVALLTLAWGGQGPAHSGRCRGATVPTTFGRYHCTKAGWVYVAPFPGPVRHT